MTKAAKIAEQKYSAEEIQACIAIIEDLIKNSEQLAYLPEEQRIALLTIAGHISRPDREEIRKRRRDRRRVKRSRMDTQERKARASTGIRSAREAVVFIAPKQITDAGAEYQAKELELKSPRACYVCKTEFTKLHFFYDAMCPRCAQFNY